VRLSDAAFRSQKVELSDAADSRTSRSIVESRFREPLIADVRQMRGAGMVTYRQVKARLISLSRGRRPVDKVGRILIVMAVVGMACGMGLFAYNQIHGRETGRVNGAGIATGLAWLRAHAPVDGSWKIVSEGECLEIDAARSGRSPATAFAGPGICYRGPKQ
jgi:hypothetical protein